MSLPLLNLDAAADRTRLDALVNRLRASSSGGASGEIAEAVSRILDDVQQNGDEAVVRYMRQWTDPDFDGSRLRVTPEEMAAAADALTPELRDALTRAIEHVREYQTHIRPTDPPMIEIDACQLGLRWTPIDRAGLAVPGGRAAYPSSLIMLAVPAQIAGTPHLAVVSPPPTATSDQPAGDISPLVLGTAHLLGLENIYRIGGAQAIAALAFGTETIPAVDFIAGPGNAYVQEAKRQLYGRVGIDGFFGPSEVVILLDASARPDRIAADLLAQAEHDPGCCFLVSTDRNAIEAVLKEVDNQLPHRTRREAIEKALREWSAAILVPTDDDADQLVDRLAGEHVTLAVADPQAALDRLSHGGAYFLSDTTPVASGDYYAGPSHCLPTGTTARFTSGCSVYTFLKRSSIEHYPTGPTDEAIRDISALATAEGLDAHAESLRTRGGS